MKLNALSISAFLLFVFGISVGKLPASAQKGERSLGVTGGYASYNKGGFGNVYFQYSVADHIRLSPSVGYVFRNENKSAFTLDMDVQFPFKMAKGFVLYPAAGLAFNNWNYTYQEDRSRGGVNFGVGMDLYLTSNLKFTLQGKYSWMKQTAGVFAGGGLGYVF